MKILFDQGVPKNLRLPNYDIALIVLRAYTNSLQDYLPIVPRLLSELETIRSRQIVYLYADESLREKDEQRGLKK